MTATEKINRQAAAALDRITEWINRSAGQHKRALKRRAKP